jgi:hypothetical protein
MKTYTVLVALLLILLPLKASEARVGETKAKIEEAWGHPAHTNVYSKRVENSDYFLDQEMKDVTYLDGVSVGETYFHIPDREVTEESIMSLVSSYGPIASWYPVPVAMEGLKMIASVDDKYRIAYGPIPNTPIEHAVSVIDLQGMKQALEEVARNKKTRL